MRQSVSETLVFANSRTFSAVMNIFDMVSISSEPADPFCRYCYHARATGCGLIDFVALRPWKTGNSFFFEDSPWAEVDGSKIEMAVGSRIDLGWML